MPIEKDRPSELQFYQLTKDVGTIAGALSAQGTQWAAINAQMARFAERMDQMHQQNLTQAADQFAKMESKIDLVRNEIVEGDEKIVKRVTEHETLDTKTFAEIRDQYTTLDRFRVRVLAYTSAAMVFGGLVGWAITKLISIGG
jgi:TolA-binding protein